MISQLSCQEKKTDLNTNRCIISKNNTILAIVKITKNKHPKSLGLLKMTNFSFDLNLNTYLVTH